MKRYAVTLVTMLVAGSASAQSSYEELRRETSWDGLACLRGAAGRRTAMRHPGDPGPDGRLHLRRRARRWRDNPERDTARIRDAGR